MLLAALMFVGNTLKEILLLEADFNTVCKIISSNRLILNIETENTFLIEVIDQLQIN